MLPITKDECAQAVFKAFTKRNMLELSSGSGQDFCDAMGEALFEIVSRINGIYMTHTHTCSAPASPSATPNPLTDYLVPPVEV